MDDLREIEGHLIRIEGFVNSIDKGLSGLVWVVILFGSLILWKMW